VLCYSLSCTSESTPLLCRFPSLVQLTFLTKKPGAVTVHSGVTAVDSDLAEHVASGTLRVRLVTLVHERRV
jgi:hypothetical protein